LLDSGAEERNRERGSRGGGEGREEEPGRPSTLHYGPWLGGSHLSPSPVELLDKIAGLRVLGAHTQPVGWKERALQSHLAPQRQLPGAPRISRAWCSAWPQSPPGTPSTASPAPHPLQPGGSGSLPAPLNLEIEALLQATSSIRRAAHVSQACF